MLAYIYTANGISLLLDGTVVTLAKDDPRFERLTEALNQGERDPEILLSIAAAPKVQLEKAIAGQDLSTKLSIVGNEVRYFGKPIDNSLTRRMLEHLRVGIDIGPLVPFLENLLQNPSFRAVQDLYSFLEKGGIPLTDDGHFLAYKYVREDYRDVHSGTFDNSVGKVVEMPRNEVDEDPNRTCSSGLHVCSYDYLPKTPEDRRVVICKVNPRDVVAIPTDYNDTKMRVCRYEVVGELPPEDGLFRNRLTEKPVFTDFVFAPEAEAPDVVVHAYTGEYSYKVEDPVDTQHFDTLEEALVFAKAQLDNLWPVIEIINGEEVKVLRYS